MPCLPVRHSRPFAAALLAFCLFCLWPRPNALGDKCPDMIILLDRSFSMAGAKWESAVAAIDSFTKAREGIMRFGLALFPWEDPHNPTCGSASWLIPCDFYTADRIAQELGWTTQGGETPTATALEVIEEGLSDSDTGRARFLILVTDGDPTCPGATLDANVDLSVAALERLREAGVPTFVIGFGSEVSPARLNQMAEAGGMARSNARCQSPTNPAIDIDCAYFDAGDFESLTAAFNDIVAIAQGELSGRTCDDSCYVIDGCPEGERCLAHIVEFDGGRHAMNLGHCAPDPCFEVDCAKNEFCREGQCVPACLSPCPTDQVCQDGACVTATSEKACATSCPKYLVCQDGTCADDPCRFVTCPTRAPYCYRGSCYATESATDASGDNNGADSDDSASNDSGCGCQSDSGLIDISSLMLIAFLFWRVSAHLCFCASAHGNSKPLQRGAA